jgi:hypothetical protein
MIGYINIYDDHFKNGVTDIDKIEIDVSRGNTDLTIIYTKILDENVCNRKPILTNPIIHICTKR